MPYHEKTALNMSEKCGPRLLVQRSQAQKVSPRGPAYDFEKRATMMIDAECQVEDDPLGQERAMWDSLGG